jgi:hypothetical protein
LELEIVRAAETETIRKMLRYREQGEVLAKEVQKEKQNQEQMKKQFSEQLTSKVSYYDMCGYK